jgi:uncharacterized protein
MVGPLRRSIVRHPFVWFYAISVAIVVATIPLFILTGAQEEVDRAFVLTGEPFNTDLLTWGRLVWGHPPALLGAFLAIVQVAAPDIAVAIVVPIAFGWRGIIDLKRRFRFWPSAMPWREGLGVWLRMLAVFMAMSLMTAGLSTWLVPVPGFQWKLDMRPAPLLLGVTTAMFLDGGALFEENGWRAFALPACSGRSGTCP